MIFHNKPSERFCSGQSIGTLVEKASAGMAFTASIHAEVNLLLLPFQLRPAPEEPKTLLRVFWHIYLSF